MIKNHNTYCFVSVGVNNNILSATFNRSVSFCDGFHCHCNLTGVWNSVGSSSGNTVVNWFVNV
jgi:hypothetical protein